MARDWIAETADKIEAFVDREKGTGAGVVCESGISPSGPIHLGNLRELMTVHLICEEIRTRGRDAEHVHSWDDLDALRRIPQDVPEAFEQYLGVPLSKVPDPSGGYPSYAAKFIDEFESAVAGLGIRPRYVRQSEAYASGKYTDWVKQAMERRFEIFDILAKYQTPGRHERSIEERRSEYYPFQVFCEACGQGHTKIVGYDETSTTVTYECGCSGSKQYAFKLNVAIQGKLLWKIDWPMRWSAENVDFEPGGEDHATEGSSYTVGREIVTAVFGDKAPFFIRYAFVGMAGRTKMSSSVGEAATPKWALQYLEPCILRWLYIRRKASDKFDINFGQELWQLYDEWDRFVKRATKDDAKDLDVRIYQRCVRTSTDNIDTSKFPVSFRLLSSAADMTNGNVEQVVRIVTEQHSELASENHLEDNLNPRLGCAVRWAMECLPEDERTQIRNSFDKETYATLDDDVKVCIEILIDRLTPDLPFEELTSLIYGVPKMHLGLCIDDNPSPEVKQFQRRFFVGLYHLICGSDTGPRLPTLFLSIGVDRVISLLKAC